MTGPTGKDLRRLKEMARYLAGAPDYKMHLIPDKGGIAVERWVDADWADDKTDRISTSGGILKYHGCTALSRPRRQGCVALSSAESELYALGSGAAETFELALLLEEWKGGDDTARDERQQQRATHREEARARKDEARGDPLPGAAAVTRRRPIAFLQ
eukprot:6394681-Pyramimonas_sp.AAC.1